MELAEALAALHARVPLGMRLGLDAMREACAREGHPERAYEVIHVAGTNGKGSTCAMVEAMGRAAGRRVGMFTSPHLVRFAERIRIDGEPITDAELCEVLAAALAHDLSFFETATLAAFLAFRRAGVELAVVEVGIGGRLDATNVVAPRVTAITGIALDHQDRLGSTLLEIAREKAGIAKPGVPMVVGPGVPREVLGTHVEAPPIDGAPFEGPHQRINAGVAWAIGAQMGWSEEVRREGLRTAWWPGRMERIGGWVLDGAHNPEGARALVEALRGEAARTVVFGALADKQWREMLGIVSELGGERLYVAPKGRAAVSAEELQRVAPGRAASLDEALASTTPGVICGSLYLVGEARAKLLGLTMDPIVAL